MIVISVINELIRDNMQNFISATLRRCVPSVNFPALMMKKLRYKYYNRRITICDNGNVQSHDQEESKLNSTINANSGTRTLTHDKIVKSSFNNNNVATIKSK